MNKTLGDWLSSENKDYFYIMHLSYGVNGQRERLWNYAIDENMIGLDLPGIVDQDWATVSDTKRQKVPRNWIRHFDMFCYEMKEGDYIVILNGTRSVLGIAKITEPIYRYCDALSGNLDNGFFDHIRKNVKWIKKYQYSGNPLPQQLTFDNTLARVTPKTKSPRWKVLTKIDA